MGFENKNRTGLGFIIMIFTVSNMWPTSKNPSYGIFVKRIHESIDHDKDIILLRQSENNLYKVFFYLSFYLQQILHYYRSNPKDIFVIHFVSLSGVGILFARIIFGARGKIVGFCHGSDLKFNKTGVKRFVLFVLTRLFLRVADSCICPSKYFYNELVDVYKYQRKIFVSPSGGVPEYMFCENPFFARKYLFGYIGRISKEKGSFDFLEAMSMIKSDLPKASILLLGSVEDLHELEIYKGKLGSRLEVMPALSHAELSFYFREIKFFIYGTHNDSLGLVGLEAMANGCIVIANCAVGPGSYVIDGVSGICTHGVGVNAIREKITFVSRLSDIEVEKLSKTAYSESLKYSEVAVRRRLNVFLNEKS